MSGQYVMPAPYGRHRPRRIMESARRRARHSPTRRDFPIPGSPSNVKTCTARSAWARPIVSRSSFSSRSRPTSAARIAGRPRACSGTTLFARTAANARSGVALPFATIGA